MGAALLLLLLTGAAGARDTRRAVVPGAVRLGALFAVHGAPGGGGACGAVREHYGIQRVEATLRALDAINADAALLPALPLGAELRDSCWAPHTALRQTIDLVRKAIDPQAYAAAACTAPGAAGTAGDQTVIHFHQFSLSLLFIAAFTYLMRLQETAPLLGVLGPGASAAAVQVQNLLQLFSIPQVSYSATSRELSDRARFATFFRVVPSDRHQARLLVALLRAHNWTYVHAVHTDESYGQSGMAAFREEALVGGVCVAREEGLRAAPAPAEVDAVLERLARGPRVAVCCFFLNLGEENGVFHTSLFFYTTTVANNHTAHLMVSSHRSLWTPATPEVLHARCRPFKNLHTPQSSVTMLWPMMMMFYDEKCNRCEGRTARALLAGMARSPARRLRLVGSDGWADRGDVVAGLQVPADGALTLRIRSPYLAGFDTHYHKLHPRNNTRNPWFQVNNPDGLFKPGTESLARGYSQEPKLALVVRGVYALAHALHAMREARCGPRPGLCAAMLPFNVSLYQAHLQRVRFTAPDGAQVAFDDNGDPPPESVVPQLALTFAYNFILIFLIHGHFKCLRAVSVCIFCLLSRLSEYDVMSFERAPGRGEGDADGVGEGEAWHYVRVGRWRRGQLHLRGGRHAPERRAAGTEATCSAPCAAGQWARAAGGGEAGGARRAPCCWTCVPCAPLAVTRAPPHAGCRLCPPGHRPDVHRKLCLPSPVEWGGGRGGGWARALAGGAGAAGLASVLLCAATFWRHRGTPVVKSASRELCALLLAAAALCHVGVEGRMGEGCDWSPQKYPKPYSEAEGLLAAEEILVPPQQNPHRSWQVQLYASQMGMERESVVTTSTEMDHLGSRRLYYKFQPIANLHKYIKFFEAALAAVARPAALPCALSRLAAPALGGVYAAVLARTVRIARLVAGAERGQSVPLLSSRAQVAGWGVLVTPGVLAAAWAAVRWPPTPRLLHPGRARAVLVCGGERATAQLLPLAPALLLLACCAVAAIRTRRLPHNFNETRFIGAATYTTGVAWLAMSALYVALEARAVALCACASLCAGACVALSLGPRAWLCLCRPQRNTRAHFLTNTSIRCHIGKYRPAPASDRRASQPHLVSFKQGT
ncbi:metabotropic glutamate receptor 1-like [Cydia pomonella]|uniref:metabotropic glutamate receptor 1-like n=1 Tax=Cydia pomonella TaxID=82600 RepID=UPI002ADD3CFB|nr:metabotropic glutamate receptor 1-like [Cydia pomonella]